MTKPELNKRVAIIGAGLIGCSWAALFMKHGWDVTIWDRSPDVYEHVSDKIARALADLEDLHDPKPETGSFTLCDELHVAICLLYTSPSPRDRTRSRMPSSA